MENVNSRQIQSARLIFFADALVLKTLCNTEALDNLEAMRSSLGLDHGSGSEHFAMMYGYKLVVATALYGLLEGVVMHPEFLGLEQDDRFQQSWVFMHNRQVIASGSAFTQPESDFAKVVTSIHGMMTQFRIADNWDSTTKALCEATPISEVLWLSATEYTPVAFSNESNTPAINEALRMGAIERLDDYLEDDRFGLTYEFLWMNREELDPAKSWRADEDPFSEIGTHLDPLPLLFPRKTAGPKWSTGITAGMSVSISQLVNEKQELCSATELFNELRASRVSLKELLSEEMGSTFPSQEFGLKGFPAANAKDLIASRSSVPYIPSDERLRALVGKEPGIIVSSDPKGATDFPIVIEGMTSDLQQGDLIEVLDIQHANPDSGDLTWFSLAIRAARFGYVSNFSKWWIFYKAHAVGPMVDSEVILAERRIEETLHKFADHINRIKLTGIDTSVLLSLFEPPAWRYVLEQARTVHDVNSDLKGVLPELLATVLVAQWDCLHIRTSFKPRVLRDRGQSGELDVLGIQPTAEGATCIVVEVKGQSTTGDELTKELEEFASKLTTLEHALPELARELSYDGHLKSLCGIFVSMARLKNFAHVDENVTLWDFARFREELDKARVPVRLTRLLEPIRIAFRIPEKTLSWEAWIESEKEM